MKSFLSVLIVPLLAVLSMMLSGCFSTINLGTYETDPLKEFTLSGYGFSKVLLISINGMISMDASSTGLFESRQGMVQEVVSQLEKAENDSRISSVLLLINSPGGTVTASDILYQKIMRFKAKTGKHVYACMMDMAASGGYYIALAADKIYANPTTLTGSVGVIFMRPELDGLMQKIGVKVLSSTSGKYKDMGSMFREESPEESKLFQEIVDNFAGQFYKKLRMNRRFTEKQMEEITTARIFNASEAKSLNLIDDIAYLDDVIDAAKPYSSTRVIVYRREKYHNDNPYIMKTAASASSPLLNTGLLGQTLSMQAGFYYLWPGVLP